MSRPGHHTDYAATSLTKDERRARRRLGKIAEGSEGAQHGDASAVGDACDAFFRRKGLRPEPLVFGRADFTRSL
jgi:hypothetical protein